MQEDVYKGRIIPAGTVVVTNIWCVWKCLDSSLHSFNCISRAMMHDERYFPDADVFNPDRHMSRKHVSQNKNVHQLNTFRPDDPSNLLFGFGRR